MKNTDLATNLFGFKIYSKDQNRLLEFLISHLEEGKKTLSIFTPNPEQLVLAKKQKSFAKSLGFADILIPDGMGLIFASRILSFFGKSESKKSNKIAERIAGIDLVRQLLKISKTNKLKVLVVGGRGYEGRKHDGLKVKVLGLDDGKKDTDKKETGKSEIWWTEGYSQVKNQTEGESKAIISSINGIKPNVVFVAFGAPFQEKWIIENKQALEETGVSIVMAVGGTFDVLFGKINRAPEWMQTLGLEWLYRLFKEPWRWRRQLGLLEFVKLTVKEIFN